MAKRTRLSTDNVLQELELNVDEPMMLGSDDEFEFSESSSEEEDEDIDTENTCISSEASPTLPLLPLLLPPLLLLLFKLLLTPMLQATQPHPQTHLPPLLLMALQPSFGPGE